MTRSFPKTLAPWIFFIALPLGLAVSALSPNVQLTQGQGIGIGGNGLGTILTPQETIIFAEIVDSPDKRAKGLMFRQSMAPDRGMLFLFPEPGHFSFWMKNTMIPLDILWLDESGTILHLEPNVPICTRKDDQCQKYQSPHKSLQVLELNAGMAEKLGLEVGGQLEIDLPPMSFPY
ncbi:MAG: DUF192 domain-containing protein [Nitrospirota bacterium]|nr:DUF192 domain-containing protein [Nitrospirota bacterium]